MKLVASAIVRNEVDRYLEVWLRHLLTFCDEVRLLDDSSEDGTPEIAADVGSEVKVLANIGPSFFENESAARNELLRWTLQGDPIYVLSIDADEFIGDAEKIRSDIIALRANVYSLWMKEVWKVGDFARAPEPGGPCESVGCGGSIVPGVGLRVDGLWGDRRCPLLWRAPRQLSRSWMIPNRKLACGREPQKVRSQRGVDTQVGIYHFGWTRVSTRPERAERYFENDGGRFHASKHLQSLLDPDEKVTLKWEPWPVSIPAEIGERALA